MCGIVGIINNHSKNISSTIENMAKTLRHRGPDDVGVWVDESKGVALGHTRLSVIDLTSEGHQPMVSPSGRYVITYNGEVYNFKELRCELESKDYVFRGSSDTEVILACFEEWGVELAIEKFNGMFVFALWDRSDLKLHLVRDRLGIKPLYFGWIDNSFFFSSELKVLQRYPDFRPEINRDSLALYLRYNYVPAPHSIYKKIFKLLPGCILTIPRSGLSYDANFSPFPKKDVDIIGPKYYWSHEEKIEIAHDNPFTGSEAEAVEYLDHLLQDSVRMRMVADVPLGAFLSGGIDSSTVVALMQKQSERQVKTFTIGFENDEYDEAKYASAIAEHLGTKHTDLYVTPHEAMEVIPALPQLYDEPFSDSSQIPTSLISHLARQHVTVSLSGDGGDELFGGYTRHFTCESIWRRIGWIAPSLRRSFASTLTLISPAQWTRFFQKFGFLIPRKRRVSMPGDKIYKLARVLKQNSPEEIYTSLVSHWQEPASIVSGATEPDTIHTIYDHGSVFPDYSQRLMYLDTITYLPDDILVKVDRASMGVGLEARVPLLDHRIVEFAWRLPTSMKIRSGEGKWILRQVLDKYVPKELMERPKTGFSVPIDEWLRGPLRDWAEDLLDEKRLRDENLFTPKPIRKKWQEHLSGRGNWQYDLWDVLMFQSWNKQRIDS